MDDQQQNPNNPPADASRDDHSARNRLMEAATKLFAEHGLEGTSTRDIAKAADLNISLISYYFGGKEGLYKAVLNEFATRTHREAQFLLQKLDLENLSRESFQATMRFFIQKMIPMKFEHQEIHILLQREVMAGLPHSKEIYENVFSKVLERVVAIYQTGQKKGFIRKDLDPYIIFFSMVHATDMYLHMGSCMTPIRDKLLKLPEQMDEYSRQMYLIFVEGVLT